MSEEGLDPRDAVLEVLLDGSIDPARRAELRATIERDPGAAAELAEFERIDDLLRTAGLRCMSADRYWDRKRARMSEEEILRELGALGLAPDYLRHHPRHTRHQRRR